MKSLLATLSLFLLGALSADQYSPITPPFQVAIIMLSQTLPADLSGFPVNVVLMCVEQYRQSKAIANFAILTNSSHNAGQDRAFDVYEKMLRSNLMCLSGLNVFDRLVGQAQLCGTAQSSSTFSSLIVSGQGKKSSLETIVGRKQYIITGSDAKCYDLVHAPQYLVFGIVNAPGLELERYQINIEVLHSAPVPYDLQTVIAVTASQEHVIFARTSDKTLKVLFDGTPTRAYSQPQNDDEFCLLISGRGKTLTIVGVIYERMSFPSSLQAALMMVHYTVKGAIDPQFGYDLGATSALDVISKMLRRSPVVAGPIEKLIHSGTKADSQDPFYKYRYLVEYFGCDTQFKRVLESQIMVRYSQTKCSNCTECNSQVEEGVILDLEGFSASGQDFVFCRDLGSGVQSKLRIENRPQTIAALKMPNFKEVMVLVNSGQEFEYRPQCVVARSRSNPLLFTTLVYSSEGKEWKIMGGALEESPTEAAKKLMSGTSADFEVFFVILSRI